MTVIHVCYNDIYRSLTHLLFFISCRLQGFPEDFSLPFTDGDNEQRHLISQFYRQIGNAASPPCVAAVAEYALSICLIPRIGDRAEASMSVFDLILNASPKREKVWAAIDRKLPSEN